MLESDSVLHAGASPLLSVGTEITVSGAARASAAIEMHAGAAQVQNAEALQDSSPSQDDDECSGKTVKGVQRILLKEHTEPDCITALAR
jgi:hypothetical protein